MVQIIADIGVNHNGDFDQAADLCDIAAKAGADIIKFQLWRKDRWPDLEYLRMPKSDIKILWQYVKHLGKEPLVTCFDIDSIRFMVGMGQTTWKIPSGLVHNALHSAAVQQLALRRKIIFSAGIDDVSGFRGENIFVLQCVSKYPTPLSESDFNGCVYDGISDHSGTIAPSVVAATRHAKYIEVHITKDKNQPGPDHKASLDSAQFGQMVEIVRQIEKMGTKKPVFEAGYKEAILERMCDV